MTALLVPLHVEALRLRRATRAVGRAADDTILPWFDGRRDHFGDVAFVASAISTEPFADHAQWLDPGVHLHWTIPAPLRRGSTRPPDDSWVHVGGLWFPPLPNRWIVVRRAPRAAWLVQSDFLHDLDQPHPLDAAVLRSLPGGPDDGRDPGATRPYRLIGRRIELDPTDLTWKHDDEAPTVCLADSGIGLTAVGDGDPTFTALYTAGRNVFGMHDAEAADLDGPLSYDVWGSYDGDIVDPLTALSSAHDEDPEAALARAVAGGDGDEPPDPDEPAPAARVPTDAEWAGSWRQHVEERFGWTMPDALVMGDAAGELRKVPLGDDRPNELRCFGRVTVGAAVDDHRELARTTSSATVAIAETVADAAAALLAWSAARSTTDEADGATATTLPEIPSLDAAVGDERVVERLAAALRDVDVSEHDLDLDAKVAEAAHRATFRSFNGPDQWVVRRHTGADTDRVAAEVTLPDDVAELLHHLNVAQAAYDRGADHADVLRQQLFSDWHHLMVAAYPELGTGDFLLDPAGLAELVERDGIDALAAHEAQVGRLAHDIQPDGAHTLTAEGGAGTLAADVVRRRDELVAALGGSDDTLALTMTPGPRFWRPRDPVLLIDTPAAHATDRFVPGPLMSEGGGLDVPAHRWAELVAAVADLPIDSQFARESDDEPWHPLLAEWEVEFRPDRSDVEPRPADAIERFDYFSGRTVLNPAATAQLVDRVGALVSRRTVPDSSSPFASAIAPRHFARLGVVQLGGFHDLLLQRRDELQLPIRDPIGTPLQLALADQVAAAIGDAHVHTPLPDAEFLPLRDGELVIERLRIVDTYGRTVEWYPNDVVAPPALATGSAAHVRLPHRLSQAARLRCGWFAARLDEVEANSHPASSPICGWLIPDDLDGAISVHDADGYLLGTVASDGTWEPAPGDDTAPRSPAQIPLPALAELVEWIVDAAAEQGADQGTMATLIADMHTAMDAIDPADAAHNTARAVFVGRPVAVARLNVGVELQHEPARDRGWSSVRTRLDGGALPSPTFADHRIAISFGVADRVGDGLVAAWVNGPDGTLAGAQRRAAGTTLDVAIVGESVTLTVLVDPRAAVHVASEVLPTEALLIPSDQYRPALDNLRVTFSAAPLLTSADEIELTLPAEPGFSWAWLQRTAAGWLRVPHHPTVHRAAVVAAFGSDGEAVWRHLVATRRVLLDDHPDEGLLMPAGRPSVDGDDIGGSGADVGGDPPVAPERLARMLIALARSVQPVSIEVPALAATGRVVARAGWLELRPVPGHHAWDPPATTSEVAS